MKVRFQARALAQIDRALGYVKVRSPYGAAKIEARLALTLILIQRQPLVGLGTRISGVRRIFLSPYPYLLDYFVGDDEIVIQRFRHTARKPSGLPPLV